MFVEFAARVLHAIATAIARVPWPLLRRLADGLAWLWRRLDARESRVARRNLVLAYPELLPAERDALHEAILRGTARQALETLRVWTRPERDNLAAIREQDGVALFDAALASGNGLIVAAPHHGNWELLNQWLASRTGLCVLYRAPASKVGEAFLRNARRCGADAGAGAGDEQDREGQRVGVDGPLELLDRRAEVDADDRQRGRDDEVVEDDHEERGRDDRERPLGSHAKGSL